MMGFLIVRMCEDARLCEDARCHIENSSLAGLTLWASLLSDLLHIKHFLVVTHYIIDFLIVNHIKALPLTDLTFRTA